MGFLLCAVIEFSNAVAIFSLDYNSILLIIMLSEILSCIILYILQITSRSLIKEGGLSDGEQ